MTLTGLLGGSFNPAHRGHRRISILAARALGLDEVWWLVSPGNPLKDTAGMAPLSARVRSARLAARGLPIRVTAIEQELGTLYTRDTLRALRLRFPERRFVWLMGGDNLAQFHRWRDWRKIATAVPIAVIARPGYDGVARRARAMGWLRRFVRPAGQAGNWTKWRPPAIVLLKLPPDPTSATGLRAADPDWHETLENRLTLERCVTPSRGGRSTEGGTLPAPAPTPPDRGDHDKVEALHELVLRSLDDDQAQEVVTIPLSGKSSIADHMVIASGRSTRQVASMAQKLTERIKKELGRNVRIEGLPIADWVLIDADDVIVHLFRPEVRSFYNLERMWSFEGDGGAAAASAAG